MPSVKISASKRLMSSGCSNFFNVSSSSASELPAWFDKAEAQALQGPAADVVAWAYWQVL